MEYVRDYIMDSRTAGDIRNKIEELSRTYTPEWKFDRRQPDIGAVIALIFSDQMADNIGRFNMLLDKYHIELVNMMGLSLLPARPACAAVIFELVPDTLPEVEIPKGTKLLGFNGEESGTPLIFETVHSIYATASRLTDLLMVSGETGRSMKIPVSSSFSLFDFPGKTMEKNALLMYHSSMFDIEEETIYMKLAGGSRVAEGLISGAFKLSCYTNEGLQPVEEVVVQEDIITFKKKTACRKIIVCDKEYSMLVLEQLAPVTDTIEISDILFSSCGRASVPDFVGNGATELDTGSFALFGETLTLYSECYIGHERYFTKAGAFITISLQVTFGEHYTGTFRQKEEENLKLIKRRPGSDREEIRAEAFAEDISIEYYNGTGWKRLACQQDYKRMFAGARAGEYKLVFVCPDDWKATVTGGYQMPCLRFRLLRSDNCYMQPCIHHYPVIRDLTVAYTYDGEYKRPERLESICGTKRMDLTEEMNKGRGIAAFSRGEYEETALYLGFDRPFGNGPVSIWFDAVNGTGLPLSYSYSAVCGFKPVRVADYTKNMSNPGMILFIPQPDMAKLSLEGEDRYWIKISPKQEGDSIRNKPYIRRILMNAAEVRNVETLDEEEFFIDQAVPGMEFTLNARNILNADVWVNETERFSDRQLKKMLAENPADVRVSYDFQGEIRELYVKWEEVSDFGQSFPTDRHYLLDRMNHKLVFGDGVHVMMPQMTKDAAFKVTVRCCDGEEGNVAAYRITDTVSNLLFVDRIYNPLPAFGGSNGEGLEGALKRGTDLLRSGRRLVTEMDYVRESLAFSDGIDKVKCIAGRTYEGERIEGVISLVLLMKDFMKGSYSFRKIENRLKEHLLKHCEISVGPEQIQITEPVFAEVSVNIWAETADMENSFEVQSLMEDTLKGYLSPLRNEKNNGWEIGSMPKISQILTKLHVIKGRARINKLTVVVRYRDADGIHEAGLEDLTVSPFFVCKNGEHRIYITASGDVREV